jgi:hypothetical protein
LILTPVPLSVKKPLSSGLGNPSLARQLHGFVAIL